MSVEEKVNQIVASVSAHKDQADKLKLLLESICTNQGETATGLLKSFVDAIITETVSLMVSRQVISELATKLTQLPDAISKEVGHHLLTVVQPRVISYEEQVFRKKYAFLINSTIF